MELITVILTAIGVVWAIVWGIYTYLKPKSDEPFRTNEQHNLGNELSKDSITNNVNDLKEIEIDKESQELEEEVMVEPGVTKDKFGNYTISREPTVFFSNRFSKSFPGKRGLCMFSDPKEAIDRLELLLKKPVLFNKHSGYGTVTDPIWWFRGSFHLFIDTFKKLNETRCLLDTKELIVEKIAAYESSAYYRNFVYIETKADKPTGLYQSTEQDIKRMIEKLGYASEEYALFREIPITRECYDDGAAEIEGKIIDTSGAELRVRYLSKYNLIIAPKYSPINLAEIDLTLEEVLNNILEGHQEIEDLIKLIETLPRNKYDQ